VSRSDLTTGNRLCGGYSMLTKANTLEARSQARLASEVRPTYLGWRRLANETLSIRRFSAGHGMVLWATERYTCHLATVGRAILFMLSAFCSRVACG
jgi:hypothetical protein